MSRATPSVRHMTTQQLYQELADQQKEWDELRADLEESGGASGSPGEWLVERVNAIDTELKRREATAN